MLTEAYDNQDADFAYEIFKNLTTLDENKIRKTLEILQKTRFTWERNLEQVRIEKPEAVGLNVDIFRENFILLDKVKHQLSRKFLADEFHKFYIFLESVNQKIINDKFILFGRCYLT